MSIKTTLTALANAVRTKSGTTGTLTLDGMTEKVNGIFSAFYTQTNGSGSTTHTFYQVPFEPDLVSMIIKWGINNEAMTANTVFSVLVVPGFNRHRRRISGTNTPQEINDSVTVTSAADSNGTYTVNVTCSGSTFPSRMPYICFLGKSNGVG